MKYSSEQFFIKKYPAYLVLLFVTILTYIKSCHFEFSPLDDTWLITSKEPVLREWDSLWKAFRDPISEIYYRPILFITFIIDYKTNGMNPFVFHITNIAFHALGVMLLYKLLQQYKLKNELAFLLSSLFAVHPVLIHSVAWIPGRNDTMLAVFSLASLIFQNKYLETGRRYNLVFLYLFFILALLTKENSIVLPLVYGFNVYIRKGRLNLKSFVHFLPSFFFITIWFFIRGSIVKAVPLYDANIWLNIKNMFLAFFIFAGKTIIPLQHSLYPTINNSSIWPGVISVDIFFMAFSFFGVKNKSIAFFGLFIFIIFLIIPLWYGSSSVTREQYENRLYLPMIGLFIFISQLNVNWDNKILKISLICLGMLYFSITFFRMDAYKSNKGYIELCLVDNPDNYFFQFRMADKCFADKNFSAAVGYYTNAIALQPNKGMFYNNRANSYTTLGNKEAALRDFDSAIVKSNNDPGVFVNRLVTLVKFNEIEFAMSELVKLKECCQKMIPIELEKEILDKWSDLGFKEILAALKTQPSNATLYVNCAKLYYDKGMLKEAIVDLKKGCALEPKNETYKKYLEMLERAEAKK